LAFPSRGAGTGKDVALDFGEQDDDG